jgi:hypothetical protein
MSDFPSILREVGLEVVAKATSRTVRQVYKWEKKKPYPEAILLVRRF